jgi:hypothetical protein
MTRMINMNIKYGKKVDGWVMRHYPKVSSALHKAIAIIIANAIASTSTSSEVGYSRNTHNGRQGVPAIPKRYNRHGIGRSTYVKAVDTLVTDGWLTTVIAKRIAYDYLQEGCSTFSPTSILLEEFEARDVSEMNTSYIKTYETIILRDKEGRELDYKNNSNADEMREVVRYLNIVNAEHVFMHNGDVLDNSSMTRIFKGAWDLGGRWYRCEVHSIRQRDGSGVSLETKETRLGLTIDNAPVVEIDYKSLHPTLICAVEGIPTDRYVGDVYTSLMNEYFYKYSFIPADRTLLKKSVITMFNTDDPQQAIGAIQLHINLNKGVYSIKRGIDVFNIIYDGMPELQPYFCRGKDVGMKLQFLDSKMIEYVACIFIEKGKALVPVHDSCVVKAEDEDLLLQTMIDAFRHVTGNYSVVLGLEIERADGTSTTHID